jgi:transcriptional regulator
LKGKRAMEQVKIKYFKNDKLITIPKKEKNKILVLQIVLEMLKEKSLEFTEKELNEAIKEIHSDYSLIRRYLVDYKFLDRDNYGRIYKVVGKKDE